MKNELIYIPVKEALYSQELGHYCSFGIEVVELGSLRLKVTDISTDGDFVAKLAKRCTAGQLDPIHFYAVIEDSLSSFSFIGLFDAYYGTHTFGDWKVTKEATTVSNGRKKRSCSVCDYTEKATIWATIIPQTGDDSRTGLWLSLMGVSLAGLLAALYLWKRRTAQEKE